MKLKRPVGGWRGIGMGSYYVDIPFHVGVMGNERLVGEAVWGDTEFAAPVRPSDF
jgi:hypothetical protein